MEDLTEYLEKECGYKVKVRCPEKGSAKKLCKMVCENAEEAAKRYTDNFEKHNEVAVRLAQLLSLEVVPELIEAYDISNIGSENITAGKVAIDGLPCEKPDKTVAGGAKISVRGLGKIRLRSAGGLTKKGRISVVIDRYV